MLIANFTTIKVYIKKFLSKNLIIYSLYTYRQILKLCYNDTIKLTVLIKESGRKQNDPEGKEKSFF